MKRTMTRPVRHSMTLHVMRLGLMLASIVLAACESEPVDSPDVARRKATCKQLNEHIFRITPQSRDQLAGRSAADQRKILDQLMAKVPIEDIEQCAAAEPTVIACMQAAPDIASVKSCIPAPKS